MLNHDFKLQPSTFYLIILSSVYIMSISAILFLPISWLYKIILIVIASWYGRAILVRYGVLKHSCSILAIARNDEGKWFITTKQSQYEASLLPDSIVTHLVSVLLFKTPQEGLSFRCVVFPDALLKDEYRKLLVLLRMF